MTRNTVLFGVVALFLAGCSNDLAYGPVDGSPGAPVSAQHYMSEGRFYVYVNSAGIPVESASLAFAGGPGEISPIKIHRPADVSAGMTDNPYSISGGMYGGRTGIGTPGTDFGATAPRRDIAQTIVVFPADKVGDGPWRFRVKVQDHPDVTIELPALGG